MKVHVGSNASLHIDKIQMETSENFMMNNEYVGIEQDGRFTINTLTIESNWVRNQLHIALNGQNIEANLHGFYLPVKKHFVDNHTRVDHLRPHCVSNELYKGMLNDQSNAVFNGKVYVHLDAQKTNAFQSNANILLSDDAQMNTKPELEIYADDVKCSHGSTTGQLDEEALFYLKSRGLGEDNARKLLANAFISDVLEKINNEAVKHYVTEQLIQRDLLFA
jgi:Fe-S cluster assembly protein SufD